MSVSRGPGVPSEGRAQMPQRRSPFRANTVAGPLAPANSRTAAPAPSAAVSGTLNRPGLGANGLTPSDSTGAIGPLHYIEMVNAQVGLYDRSLTNLSTVNLGTFIGAATGAKTGDPQIQWDQQGRRWLYVSLELYSTGNKLAVGWSKRDDLSTLTLGNTDWCNFHIDTGLDLHDYPKLGHDGNFILVGVNLFTNGARFDTSRIWAIPKPAPGDGTCTPVPARGFGTAASPLTRLPPNQLNRLYTPVPANTADASLTGYISAIDLDVITILHVSPSAAGCVSAPCLVTDGEIAITSWAPPPAGNDFRVPQPAGNPPVSALNGILTQAVQRSDPMAAGAEAVWTQHTNQDPSGRTVVTWFELIPSQCAATVCAPTAKRQEGVIANPSLYLFNGAISPTMLGDAAVIHYSTASTSTFIEARAQSRGGLDPLNAMSGEVVLRTSTVYDTDNSCSAPSGPPCRWGDYAGASPDPMSCSLVWGSTMLTGDVASTGAPTWVTQNFALSDARVPSASTTASAVSSLQYTLAGSDGATWVDIDPLRLQVGAAPCTDGTGVITANLDLFTSTAGINQDIGIFVDVDGVAATSPVAWKESGGANGTFSPNAAYVQTYFSMQANHIYTVRLKWKANQFTNGTIYAGAGPLPASGFSPSRLTLDIRPTGPLGARTTTQPFNIGSDGKTWIPIPGVNSVLLVGPPAGATALLGGNADLWTDTAGYNQDIGILVSGGTFGAGEVVAWKESGGLSGTYSPNAAFVEVTVALAATVSYSVQLVWKSSQPAPLNVAIHAGAGPLPGGAFSPTSLTALLLPVGPNPYESVTTTQKQLVNSDGSNWIDLGVQVGVSPSASVMAIISANIDLWTAVAGYNQDVAVFVSDNGAPAQLLVWKESGGSGGIFSPNAAMAETVFTMAGGHSYLFSLKWKTNKSAAGSGAAIYAGAGPIAGAYSPTRLLVNLVT